MKPFGVIAAGHKETVRTAEIILREGGNAFDACIAAHFTACVAEPVLASLGGGGFMLAHTSDNKNVLYDFFVQTPRHKQVTKHSDFNPIFADFGAAQQEFHIGMATCATPGSVKGVFTIFRDLCSMPIKLLMEPAIELAKDGVKVNPFQAYIFNIVCPIITATPEARDIYSNHDNKTRLIDCDEILRQPLLANTFEALSHEGEALFYQGEIARSISRLCADGNGHLGSADLDCYQTIKRAPLEFSYRNSTVLSNPPPSSGGILIAFALKLLEGLKPSLREYDSQSQLAILAQCMDLTNKARIDAHLNDSTEPELERLLDPGYLAIYRQQILECAASLRGTTHISIIDKSNNIASMSLSNGEGCGHMIPGTGIMLNNMLGEEDLNPGGFHNWPENQRMTSMMSPSIVFKQDGKSIALGSGGSNRIRTAILQVLVNLLEYDMSLTEAINQPRIHKEGSMINIEGGFNKQQVQALVDHFPDNKVWQEHNLFFGGTHSVMYDGKTFIGAGDPRRGGVAIVVD